MKTNLLQKNIPKGWEIKKIKDLLDFEQPTKYIVESSIYTLDGKTPVLTANKSFVLGYTNETDGVYTNTPAIIFDDFTTDSKYVDFPFKIKSSAIKILTNRDENTDLKFVYEIMKSFNFPIANHKRHYISQYQELDIVVPSTKEQKKIAEILSSVDEEIQKVEEIISATEKLKKGVVDNIITNDKGFDKSKLIEIATINMGQSPTSNSYNNTGDGLPLLQGKADFSKENNTPQVRQWTTSPTKISEIGDILLTVRAPVGEVFLNNIKACIGRGITSIRTSGNVVQNYIYYALQGLNKEMNSKAQGSTFTAINSDSIKNLLIPVPPHLEQLKIVNLLTSVDQKIDFYKNLKSKLLGLKKGLVSDLLSGKVRIINN